MAGIKFFEGLGAGPVQREFGQFGDAARDHAQGLLLIAVQLDQAVHDQLPKNPQRSAGLGALST